MIGTALVGLGEVGQVHLRALASHAGSQLRVLCDLDSELLARDAHNAVSATRDLDELLADTAVSVVSICLPHHLHEPVAIRCLEAGKHVLLEKPMTMTVAQADRVLAIARATGRRVGVSHNQVFFRPHAEARRMIVAGELGTLHQLRARLVIGGTYGAWRSDPALAGGGLLIDAGVHRIYTLRHLAGEIHAVSAVMRDPGNEEAFIVTLEHESGAVSVIDGCYHGPAGVFDDQIEIVGSQALLQIVGCEAFFEGFAHGPQLRIHRDGAWHDSEVTDTWDSSVIASVQGFVDAIAADRDPPVTGADGRSVVAAIEAAYESARTRRRVEVAHA